jgi:hypothetical protein
MFAPLCRLLDALEARVSPERAEASAALFRDALAWRPVPRLPLTTGYPLPEGDPVRPVPVAETLRDPEKMLYNELVHAWTTSIWHQHEVGDDLPFTLRANFGTGVVSSLFGAPIEQVENNPPWVRRFETWEAFRGVLERDPLDFSQGLGPRVVETYEAYAAILARYPSLRGVARLVLPDLQGPMDNAELLRGSGLFTDFYERPEETENLLGLLAAAQVGFAKRLKPLLNDGPEGYSHQHGSMLKGHILLRNDSAIMLSAKMYRERVAPHDARVLREMGGGGIHSCGNFAHLAEAFLDVKGVESLDLGQPEMNDIPALYRLAAPRKVALLRIQFPAKAMAAPRELARLYPTGMTLLHHAPSLAAARELVAAYRR